MALRNGSVSVALTPREKAALVNYCDALGATMSEWVRAMTLPEIPPEFWQPLPVPPGQMQIEEAEREAG